MAGRGTRMRPHTLTTPKPKTTAKTMLSKITSTTVTPEPITLTEEEYEYLGNILAADGSHTKKIKARVKKGNGIIDILTPGEYSFSICKRKSHWESTIYLSYINSH